MKLIINGFPKTGTHALAKAVQLLGVPCDVAHLGTYRIDDVIEPLTDRQRAILQVAFQNGHPAPPFERKKIGETIFQTPLPEHTHHIMIKRDPRNVLVSWLRHTMQSVTPGILIANFRSFKEVHDGREQKSMPELMAQYEKFLNDPDTMVVKFEDLIEDEKVLKYIAGYLGVPYIEGAFEELPGMTVTWTGKLSDWKEVWTPEVEKVWNEEGGKELLARWGYK